MRINKKYHVHSYLINDIKLPIHTSFKDVDLTLNILRIGILPTNYNKYQIFPILLLQ